MPGADKEYVRSEAQKARDQWTNPYPQPKEP
jgi:hypothetical protein